MKANSSTNRLTPTELLVEFNKLQRFRVKPNSKEVKAGDYLRVYCIRGSNMLSADYYSFKGVAKKHVHENSHLREQFVIYHKNSPTPDEVYAYIQDFARFAQAYRYNSKVLNFFRILQTYPIQAADFMGHSLHDYDD